MSTIPAYPKPISLAQARIDLPPEEFRTRLRSHLLSNPSLTLAQVAQQLGLKRQRISQMVGRLNRPNASSPLFMRLAPKTERARLKLPELTQRVARGESAKRAAQKLGISLAQAYKLGFRSKLCRPPHGTATRAQHCRCWRCRRTQGVAIQRGPKINTPQRMAIEDWLAWSDPQDGRTLTQQEIARLVGSSQGAVSRISRSEYAY
jgi:predicted XRE-type DNA-binding protein